MKAHFIQLFDYEHFANKLILKVIAEANYPEKPVQLMAHLLTAHRVWLNRCMRLPPATVELWPALGTPHDDLSQIINDNHQAWANYLTNLPEADFEQVVHYQSTKGESFESQLNDIFTQVINHGTHHRAQIGQLVKLAGVENLPVTDYIFYLRAKNAQ